LMVRDGVVLELRVWLSARRLLAGRLVSCQSGEPVGLDWFRMGGLETACETIRAIAVPVWAGRRGIRRWIRQIPQVCCSVWSLQLHAGAAIHEHRCHRAVAAPRQGL
jgi:hypothetical protein